VCVTTQAAFFLAWNFTLLQNFFLIVSQNSMIFFKKTIINIQKNQKTEKGHISIHGSSR
jgi:hypothetical protein